MKNSKKWIALLAVACMATTALVGCGKDGAKGDKGDTGATGATGADGKSAYEIWEAQEGNDGKTLEEYLASLKGEKGDEGEKGATGDSGYDAAVEAGFEGTEAEWLAAITNHNHTYSGYFYADMGTGVVAYQRCPECSENGQISFVENIDPVAVELGAEGVNLPFGSTAGSLAFAFMTITVDPADDDENTVDDVDKTWDITLDSLGAASFSVNGALIEGEGNKATVSLQAGENRIVVMTSSRLGLPEGVTVSVTEYVPPTVLVEGTDVVLTHKTAYSYTPTANGTLKITAKGTLPMQGIALVESASDIESSPFGENYFNALYDWFDGMDTPAPEGWGLSLTYEVELTADTPFVFYAFVNVQTGPNAYDTDWEFDVVFTPASAE